MWKRIKSWFTRTEEEKLNIYSVRERLIYEYFDGKNLIKVDPMVLYKRISGEGNELATEMKVANSPSKDALSEHNKMILRIRRLFNIAPYDPSTSAGLTELETMNLFDATQLWPQFRNLPLMAPSAAF